MSEEEIWKDVVGYEGLYQVSNLGRVKSLFRYKKILKQFEDNKGYLRVTLYKNNKSKSIKVHKLVAEAFIPNPNNYDCINHKDENKTNNRVENLEFCSFYYNLMYGTRVQRIAKKNNKPILQFDLEGNFIKEYESITQASKELNIKIDYISSCCLGRRRKTKGYVFKFKNDKEILSKYKEIIGVPMAGLDDEEEPDLFEMIEDMKNKFKHIEEINKSYPIFNFDKKSFEAMKDMLQDVYSKQVEIIKSVNYLFDKDERQHRKNNESPAELN